MSADVAGDDAPATLTAFGGALAVRIGVHAAGVAARLVGGLCISRCWCCSRWGGWRGTVPVSCRGRRPSWRWPTWSRSSGRCPRRGGRRVPRTRSRGCGPTGSGSSTRTCRWAGSGRFPTGRLRAGSRIRGAQRRRVRADNLVRDGVLVTGRGAGWRGPVARRTGLW
jgi:hypothetical protein